MSIREVQDIIFHLGLFMFRGGSVNEGMLVSRYNIREARIEYYFIPVSNVGDYHAARNGHDRNAHVRLGNPVDVNTIIRAQLFK